MKTHFDDWTNFRPDVLSRILKRDRETPAMEYYLALTGFFSAFSYKSRDDRRNENCPARTQQKANNSGTCTMPEHQDDHHDTNSDARLIQEHLLEWQLLAGAIAGMAAPRDSAQRPTSTTARGAHSRMSDESASPSRARRARSSTTRGNQTSSRNASCHQCRAVVRNVLDFVGTALVSTGVTTTRMEMTATMTKAWTMTITTINKGQKGTTPRTSTTATCGAQRECSVQASASNSSARP